MSTTAIVIIVIVAVIALVLITRDSGPRITTVERRKDVDEDEDRNA